MKHRQDTRKGIWKGFLKAIPFLHKTPPLSIKEPTGKNDIRKGLKSEEGGINEATEQKTLYKLHDDVLRSRVEGFQWDSSNCVEGLNGKMVILETI